MSTTPPGALSATIENPAHHRGHMHLPTAV